MFRTYIKRGLKIFAVVFLIALIVGPSILHSQAGIGISPILTGSMRPYANPGDVFITKQEPASQLKVGDIISVHSQATGIFYAHRISEIRAQSALLRITTKGDANTYAETDPFMVAGTKPVSTVVMKVKWLGRPLVYLTSVQGRQGALMLLVIANVIALLLFLFKKKNVVSESTITSHRADMAHAHEQMRIKEHENHSLKGIIININAEKEVLEASLKVQQNPVIQLQLKEI
jgi:signal peptidase I